MFLKKNIEKDKNESLIRVAALLIDAARFFGITYEEINVWLFCIAWPLTSIAMLIWILLLRRKNLTLRRVLDYQ